MIKLPKDFLARYIIQILVAIPNLWIFYFVFTPITIYPLYFLFDLFFDAYLVENVITVGDIPVEIIPACVAGAAYYLLLILNLATPKIEIKKRIKMIFFAFASLLIINILRMFFLILLYFVDPSLFYITHKVLWYTLSIFLVVGIWFTEVNIFKIKEIPFYSDLKYLYKNIKYRKRK